MRKQIDQLARQVVTLRIDEVRERRRTSELIESAAHAAERTANAICRLANSLELQIKKADTP